MPLNVLLVQKPRRSGASIYRRGDRTLRRIVLSLLLAAGACTATPDISTETAPAGGWAQIKIGGVASGQILMDLDPSVFGDIADAAVFSANGDAYGSAAISGRHLRIVKLDVFVDDAALSRTAIMDSGRGPRLLHIHHHQNSAVSDLPPLPMGLKVALIAPAVGVLLLGIFPAILLEFAIRSAKALKKLSAISPRLSAVSR